MRRNCLDKNWLRERSGAERFAEGRLTTWYRLGYKRGIADRQGSAVPLPLLALAVCALMLGMPASAGASVSGVQPIDGPSPDVVAVEDAAMAEDGSGGLVYLKKEGGRNHVFVARFDHGAWSAPQRVDVGQAFDSSWARIAAGDGGRLLVTWVQEFGVGTDRMFSATLDPGATGFQEPVPVDMNVGEATSTFPDLAMNAGGQAYLTYLVITDNSSLNPPHYLGLNVRVARYNNRLWSVLGNPVDRNPATPMPEPSEATGPKIGIDSFGQAVVAWREPDDEFVNRIWARRVFGSTVGVPLQVSPASWEGTPLRAEADAFDLDDAGFGQAAVAFRQQPGQGSKLSAPRVFVNEMPDAYAEGASAFHGARLIDGGARGALGAPSVAVQPEGGFLAGFASGAATLLSSGDNEELNGVERIDAGSSTIAGEPRVDVAESSASVAAWKELNGGAGTVAVRERRADGVVEPAALAAPGGGSIGRLVLGGSGLGDAIVAWGQGSGQKAQIAAAVVDAPPDPFLIEVPSGWQNKAKLRISWGEATNGIGGLRYSVSVGDEPIGRKTTHLQALIPSRRIGEGVHQVQVFAIDDAGQETGSRKALLRIDRKPPRVRLRQRGSRLTVVATDKASGFKRGGVKVSFGDGRAARASAAARARRKSARKNRPVTITHRFAGPGSYRVEVKARDRAGNKVSFSREVRVP